MEKKRILFVDDDPSMRLLLEHFLQKNYDVITLQNGKEALLWLNSNKGKLPDLIIADILMPGMHGFDFLEHLKASAYLSSIPIIMLSSLDKSIDKIKCFKLGAEDYLIKPFNPEELLFRIEKIIHQKSAA